jgi:hypothetical protein
MNPSDLHDACLLARIVGRTAKIVSLVHSALRALESGTISGATQAHDSLVAAAAKLRDQAPKMPSWSDAFLGARPKSRLAESLEKIAAAISAPSSVELSPALCVLIAGHLDDLFASLKGRWCAPDAHAAIAQFLLGDQSSQLTDELRQARLFDIGEVGRRGSFGLRFLAQAGVPTAFLFRTDGTGAAWVPVTFGPFFKSTDLTRALYLAVESAVNTRQDIQAHIAHLARLLGHQYVQYKPLCLMQCKATTALTAYPLVPANSSAESESKLNSDPDCSDCSDCSYFTIEPEPASFDESLMRPIPKHVHYLERSQLAADAAAMSEASEAEATEATEAEATEG